METNDTFDPLNSNASESTSEWGRTPNEFSPTMEVDGSSADQTNAHNPYDGDSDSSGASGATVKQSDIEYNIKGKLISDPNDFRYVMFEVGNLSDIQSPGLKIKNERYLRFAKNDLIRGEGTRRKMRERILNGSIDKNKSVLVSMKGKYTAGMTILRAPALSR